MTSAGYVGIVTVGLRVAAVRVPAVVKIVLHR
jgi:hypothetical protein